MKVDIFRGTIYIFNLYIIYLSSGNFKRNTYVYEKAKNKNDKKHSHRLL
jgi:hypothetical protein